MNNKDTVLNMLPNSICEFPVLGGPLFDPVDWNVCKITFDRRFFF